MELLPQIQNQRRQAVGACAHHKPSDKRKAQSRFKLLTQQGDFRKAIRVGLKVNQKLTGFVALGNQLFKFLDLLAQIHGERLCAGGRSPDVTKNTGLHPFQAATVGTIIHDRNGNFVDFLAEAFLVELRNCVIRKTTPAFFHSMAMKKRAAAVNKNEGDP